LVELTKVTPCRYPVGITFLFIKAATWINYKKHLFGLGVEKASF